MKAGSLNELKAELKSLPPDKILEVILRMAKYKKENKELLTYLLFEADDEKEFIRAIKEEIDVQFAEMNRSHIRFVTKSLRKILRSLNKYIKFSGQKQTEAEILIYFCGKIRESGIRYTKYTVLDNMYNRQIIKIEKAVSGLHEDLQYDYMKMLESMIL
jgi:glycerophosphoryl diester phosphodiesterase